MDFKRVVRGSALAVLANATSLVASAAIVALLPKVLGVTDFAYWQLYAFYATFVGFLHFGWIDGIYLRLGGEEYKSLDFARLKAQLVLVALSQTFAGAMVVAYGLTMAAEPERELVLVAVGVCVVLINLRIFFSYVLQSTFRIREYSLALVIERAALVLFFVLATLIGVGHLWVFIVIDLICKGLGLTLAATSCGELVRSQPQWAGIWREVRVDVVSGLPLMFSNVAAMLALGIVRLVIERNWGIDDFGHVSLMLSLCLLFMGFASALGIVLFPVLRRISVESARATYSYLRPLIDTIFLVMGLGYFLLVPLVDGWLPDYSESVRYLLLLFPIVFFDGTTAVLLTSYMKSMRQERGLLAINLAGLAAAGALALIGVMQDSIAVAVIGMAVASAVRSLGASIYLGRALSHSTTTHWLVQAAGATVFVASGWWGSVAGVAAFSLFLAALGYARRASVREMLAAIRPA